MSPSMNTPPAIPAASGNTSSSQGSNGVTVRQLGAITTSAYICLRHSIHYHYSVFTRADLLDRRGRATYNCPGLLTLGKIHQYLDQEYIIAAHALLHRQYENGYPTQQETNITCALVKRSQELSEAETVRRGHQQADAAHARSTG